VAQDTILTKIFTFEEPVYNIDGGGEVIIARTPSAIYRLNEEKEFEVIQRLQPENIGKHTWLNKIDRKGNFTTYHTDYLPPKKIAPYDPVGMYLPGYHHDNITVAKDGDEYYAVFRGSILKYEIRTFYKIKNRWESVRHIYVDDSTKITSTYSAIYKDSGYNVFGLDTIKGITYASGEASKINNQFYLCSDDLFRLEAGKWNKVVLSTATNHHFRKLVAHNKDVYYLSNEGFGRIDLINDRIIDTILLTEKNEFFDVAWLDNKAYVSNRDGYVYIYEQNKPIVKVLVGSPVYDVNFCPENEHAILSTKSGIFELDLSNLKSKMLHPIYDAVQTIYVNGELLIATGHGLYIKYGEKIYELIPNTEFNKYGLVQFRDMIFAGSIEGLFVIDKGILLNDVVNSFKSVEFKSTQYKSNWILAIFLGALLVFISILLYHNRQRKKQVAKLTRKSMAINPENIRQVVLDQPGIISVEAVAEYFETSTVQLNRILKKYNTSGLILLKAIKQDIVRDMLAQEKSMEEISKRVGYSINYIKRNLL
jgi:AraC-like DNA-binding protein